MHIVFCTLFERPRETCNCWGRGDEPSADFQQPAVGQAQEPSEALGEQGEPELHSLTPLLVANITVQYFLPVESGAVCSFLGEPSRSEGRSYTVHLHQKRGEIGFSHKRDPRSVSTQTARKSKCLLNSESLDTFSSPTLQWRKGLP